MVLAQQIKQLNLVAFIKINKKFKQELFMRCLYDVQELVEDLLLKKTFTIENVRITLNKLNTFSKENQFLLKDKTLLATLEKLKVIIKRNKTVDSVNKFEKEDKAFIDNVVNDNRTINDFCENYNLTIDYQFSERNTIANFVRFMEQCLHITLSIISDISEYKSVYLDDAMNVNDKVAVFKNAFKQLNLKLNILNTLRV